LDCIITIIHLGDMIPPLAECGSYGSLHFVQPMDKNPAGSFVKSEGDLQKTTDGVSRCEAMILSYETWNLKI